MSRPTKANIVIDMEDVDKDDEMDEMGMMQRKPRQAGRRDQ